MSRRGTQPARMRSACNNCNAAKLKCSGERSGCQRCLNSDLDCVFQESRVGKVPGIRSRARKELIAGGSRPGHCDGINRPVTARTIAPALSPAPVGTPFLDEEHHLHAEATRDESTQGLVDLDYYAQALADVVVSPHSDRTQPGELRDPQTNLASSPMNQSYQDFDLYAFPLLELGELNLNLAPHAASPFAHMPQPPDLALSSPDQHDQAVPTMPEVLSASSIQDLQMQRACIHRCLAIIELLEECITGSLNVPQLVFDTVDGVLMTLTTLVEHETGDPIPRCITLFGVILEQVVKILLSTAARISDRSTSDLEAVSMGNTFDSISIPGLNFSMMKGRSSQPNETFWQAHLLRRAAANTVEAIQAVHQLCALSKVKNPGFEVTCPVVQEQLQPVFECTARCLHGDGSAFGL